MSAKTAQQDSEGMYWCIKCGKRHRRNSSIGSWHSPLERPDLEESNLSRSRRSKPDKSTFAAAIALALELEERDASEVKFEHYQQRYRDEGFDELRNARDAIYSLRDDWNDVIVRRHSAHEWLAFEATGNDAMRLRDAARNYKSLGMTFGVRH
jgi:hypothetical protein